MGQFESTDGLHGRGLDGQSALSCGLVWSCFDTQLSYHTNQ